MQGQEKSPLQKFVVGFNYGKKIAEIYSEFGELSLTSRTFSNDLIEANVLNNGPETRDTTSIEGIGVLVGLISKLPIVEKRILTDWNELERVRNQGT